MCLPTVHVRVPCRLRAVLCSRCLSTQLPRATPAAADDAGSAAMALGGKPPCTKKSRSGPSGKSGRSGKPGGWKGSNDRRGTKRAAKRVVAEDAPAAVDDVVVVPGIEYFAGKPLPLQAATAAGKMETAATTILDTAPAASAPPRHPFSWPSPRPVQGDAHAAAAARLMGLPKVAVAELSRDRGRRAVVPNVPASWGWDPNHDAHLDDDSFGGF